MPFFSYFVIGTISTKLDQVLLETAMKLSAPLCRPPPAPTPTLYLVNRDRTFEL